MSEPSGSSGPMPPGDPDPTAPPALDDIRRLAEAEAEATRAAAHEVDAQTMRALGRIVGRITPWLIEFGSWIFAGLIAFILFVLPPLVTIGPVDRAVLIASVALALALPVNLAGLIILRLIQDIQRIGLGVEAARLFQEAGLPMDTAGASTPEWEARQASRVNLVLLYALVILALSAVLTLTGIVAALWHMRWWIGVAFLVMLVVSLGAILAALIVLRPPQTPAERERYQRYWETLLAQARAEQARKQRQGSA